MSKIVFLDAFTLNSGDISWSNLLQLGEVKIFERYTSNQESKMYLSEAEILIVNKVKVDNSLLALTPKLKYIVVAATGYNNVDLSLLSERNILVSNVKGYSTEGVVQHVFAALLSHFNRLEYYANQVKEGRWQKTPDFCFYDHSIIELAGKTMGILGYGTIGKRVAQVAEVFNMDVIVYNKYGSGRQLSTKISEVDLSELFRRSDILSLHVPYNNQTKEIINKDHLSLVKESITLVNTGRGGLVNENELADFLQKNKNAAALLDVIQTEPPQDYHPLYSLPNCHITPHIAWASKESRIRLLAGLVENIKAFQSGHPINIVN
jgi:glycerate dehydrogenase